MSAEAIQLGILSSAVIVNLPILGFIALLLWRFDNRLVRIETTLEIKKEQQNARR
jgi:hypothetical protein